jgi:hypothetical protein
VNIELTHYESLKVLIPEKAAVIKNYKIKLDLVNNDFKIAEEKGWKANIQ